MQYTKTTPMEAGGHYSYNTKLISKVMIIDKQSVMQTTWIQLVNGNILCTIAIYAALNHVLVMLHHACKYTKQEVEKCNFT